MLVYSQVLKGAAYMNIAADLATDAAEELGHAMTIAKQIDYLGGMPTVTPLPVKTSEKAEEMLRFDLENENETICAITGDVVRLRERRSASMPWPSTSGTSSWSSRSTRPPWRPPSASMSPTRPRRARRRERQRGLYGASG